MNELALFAGAGGGILGGKLLGWRTVCAVEYAEYPRRILLARQNDGTFPPFQIWDDVRTFEGRPWRGIVDVVSAGFPCQPFSVAGKQKAGDDLRNGWPDTIRIIREVRPRYAFLENVPGLLAGSHGYFGRVLGDLAEAGYDAVWTVLGAADAGAPHKRDRLWILAYPRRGERRAETVADPKSQQRERIRGARSGRDGFADRRGTMADTDLRGRERLRDTQRPIHPETQSSRKTTGALDGRIYGVWPPEPGMGRVVDGMADRAHRIRALGNGQVPRVVAMAWDELMYMKERACRES